MVSLHGRRMGLSAVCVCVSVSDDDSDPPSSQANEGKQINAGGHRVSIVL